MKKITTLICLVYFALIVNAHIDSLLSNQLQTVLNNAVDFESNNGVSAFLISPNLQTWSGTAGVGKQNIAVTDTTLFNAASTTKLNI